MGITMKSTLRSTATQHSYDKRLVTLTAPLSFAAEQYQGLRMTVEQLKRLRDVRLIAVTSPSAGDGKTLTSINLAGVLSHGSDAQVLLIDADLRRPEIATRLGISKADARGLVDVVADERITLDEVTRKIDGFNLSVVPAGVTQLPIHEILRSPRLERVLQAARDKYDFVIVDTPPLLPVFDASMVAKLVDGLLLVVSANQTPRKLLGESLTHLDPSKVLGLVFNRDTQPLFGYYNKSYYGYFDASAGAA
jgi:capsular exopolysaccharide synthesis family protein